MNLISVVVRLLVRVPRMPRLLDRNLTCGFVGITLVSVRNAVAETTGLLAVYVITAGICTVLRPCWRLVKPKVVVLSTVSVCLWLARQSGKFRSVHKCPRTGSYIRRLLGRCSSWVNMRNGLCERRVWGLAVETTIVARMRLGLRVVTRVIMVFLVERFISAMGGRLSLETIAWMALVWLVTDTLMKLLCAVSLHFGGLTWTISVF